jgi:hypothetical protein
MTREDVNVVSSQRLWFLLDAFADVRGGFSRRSFPVSVVTVRAGVGVVGVVGGTCRNADRTISLERYALLGWRVGSVWKLQGWWFARTVVPGTRPVSHQLISLGFSKLSSK